jgi:hypothetical protein
MSNIVLHDKLKEVLTSAIIAIRENMIARFAIMLPYDQIQSMLMSEATLAMLQTVGKCMSEQRTYYTYKLGEKVTVGLSCRGGKEMPTILFPNEEHTNFSEDFLDLIRPLYLITKSWMDVELAFEAVCNIVQDTRELNFYVPWLRHIIPDRGLTNEFNAPYRVSRWLELTKERKSTIAIITRQVRYILTNKRTNKRTWMPSELVQMVRQGEELIAQWNIMKQVVVPDTYHKKDTVIVEIVINTKDHPTIAWVAEAHSYRTMKEAERLKELDKKKNYGSDW